MRNKWLKYVTTVLLALLLTALPVCAQANGAAQVADDILAAQTDDVQAWIDGALSEAPEVSEWYAIVLRQYGTYDFSRYEKALSAYLKDNTVRSASSRQKYALALVACGSTDAYIDTVLEDSIGKQGLMSWVFGLHLLNNGCHSTAHSAETVTAQLLSLQHADGGWSVSGNYGDTDATAMTIQALAPQYGKTDEVTAAVDKAIGFLSASQQADGDYISYGVANAESTAQVLIALSAVGIDAMTDARFIKSGNTAFDGLSRYRLTDGQYCHQRGGEANQTATVQALAAAVAYQRFQQGKAPLYVLDSRDSARNARADYRVWVSGAIASLAVIGSITLFFIKKRKNIAIIVIVAVLLIAGVWLVQVQTTDEYYAGMGEHGQVVGTVTLSIDCHSIADKSASHIPDDGVLLTPMAVSLYEGETVLDVLTRVTAKQRIHLETVGGYVQGIGNIYEFDHGDLSGWVYLIDGREVKQSSATYRLSDGNVIEWKYVCTVGDNLK